MGAFFRGGGSPGDAVTPPASACSRSCAWVPGSGPDAGQTERCRRPMRGHHRAAARCGVCGAAETPDGGGQQRLPLRVLSEVGKGVGAGRFQESG
jgi:hypothetical protein